MSESTNPAWSVKLTFICDGNNQSNTVKEALRAFGDSSKTELMMATDPEDIRVMQVVQKTVTAPDEAAVYAKAEKRYGEIIAMAEGWECDVTAPDPEGEETHAEQDDDDDDMQEILNQMGPELLEIARERGFSTGSQPEPLTINEASEGRRMQLAALICEAVEEHDLNHKQWYLWQIARQAGVEHLVKGIFSASGYGPVEFDDTDLMGVAP